MQSGQRLEQLIECLIHVIGRAALPEAKVADIVGNGRKQRTAFNLADGTRTQQEIAKATRIDQGNLSRTFQRWVDHGAAFWIGEGKDVRLLHVYPLAANGGGDWSKGGRGHKK